MNLNVTLNKGNNPSVSSGVVEVNQVLNESLVKEEPVIDGSPCPRIEVVRSVWLET